MEEGWRELPPKPDCAVALIGQWGPVATAKTITPGIGLEHTDFPERSPELPSLVLSPNLLGGSLFSLPLAGQSSKMHIIKQQSPRKLITSKQNYYIWQTVTVCVCDANSLVKWKCQLFIRSCIGQRLHTLKM